MQQLFFALNREVLGVLSQSPYGAKWFATCRGLLGGALLVGCRNPLTGLSGLQLQVGLDPPEGFLLLSQSPYGAKWFAT